ncbi:unnamed protein product [Spirodela intermedia]|uniref:Uncharacterized protein n=1 Tax=Spirodela intermedia TaxID=51605 RepID=A0A7I8KA90_SPIIN|nr:unnamed protein product [Spirodela intermedia]
MPLNFLLCCLYLEINAPPNG